MNEYYRKITFGNSSKENTIDTKLFFGLKTLTGNKHRN